MSLVQLKKFQDLYDAIAELLADKSNRKELEACGQSIYNLYETTLEQTCKDVSFTQLLINAKALIDFSNEAVLLYHFKDVPAYWRRMMMDAGLLKAMIQLKSILTTAEQQTDFEVLEPQVQAIIGDLDICSVVSGCPGPGRRFLANIIVEELQDWLTNGRCKDQQPKFKKTKLSIDMLPTSERPHVDYPIKRFTEPPSFEWFLKHCDQNVPTPFIISKGAIDHWPAFNEHPWSNMEYLKSIAADRMVPVEIGSQYTDANWSQKMIRFSDFITEHILQQQEKAPAYLAQHDLFYQVPRLERDIIVPDYCYIEPKLNQLYTSHADDVIKNAWFGPKGTVSPLHQDPYHNLLCQVVGSKYVRLISPLQSDLVYPRDGLMTNTSQVDVECVDLEQFPRFKDVEYVDCILEEGQVLYIPPKWWHYIKSLETSFSVNRGHPKAD